MDVDKRLETSCRDAVLYINSYSSFNTIGLDNAGMILEDSSLDL